MFPRSLVIALCSTSAFGYRTQRFHRSLKRHVEASAARHDLDGIDGTWPVRTNTSAADVAYSHDHALLHFNYAQSTFCDEDVLRRWDCGTACRKAPVVSGSVRLLGPGDRFQVRGIVAAIPSAHGPTCVVGFRGSVDIENWYADAMLFPIEWPEPIGAQHKSCRGCLVHEGIAEAYAELESQMNAALEELGCQKTAVVGHSLGAGVATLAAFRIRSALRIKVEPVYLFGAPRVGNQHFASEFAALAADQAVEPPAWRIVHYKDPVPRLWPRNLFYSYVHVSREVYYSWDETSYRVCTDDSLDLECSYQYGLAECLPRIPNHLTYFNRSLQVRLMDPLCVAQEPDLQPDELVIKMVDVAGRFGRLRMPGEGCEDLTGWTQITSKPECEVAAAAVASAESLAASIYHEVQLNNTAVVNNASQVRGCHAVCPEDGVCSLVVNQFNGSGSGPKPSATEHMYCKTQTGEAVVLQEGHGWMQWWTVSEEGGAHAAATLGVDAPAQNSEENVTRSHNISRWAEGFAAWESNLNSFWR